MCSQVFGWRTKQNCVIQIYLYLYWESLVSPNERQLMQHFAQFEVVKVLGDVGNHAIHADPQITLE